MLGIFVDDLETLAAQTELDKATISRLEREPRDPRASSPGKLANILEVSVGFLLAAEDDQIEFAVAVRHQSLRKFLLTNPLSEEHKKHFEQLCFFDSGPNTVRGWQDLLQNATFLLAQKAIME